MIFGLRSLFDYDFGVEPRNAMARLIAHSVQPILAVSDNYRDVRRVLLTYSGSPKSAAAIKRIVQLQLWPDAALRIVTFDRPVDEAKRLLREAAAYCELHGRKAEVHYARGKPQDLIPQNAKEWEADLVVLGTSTETLVCDDNWANSESTLAGLVVRQAVGTTALHLIKNASRAFFLSH
jgi:nucleotide-binding universal stress UspA family protein